MTTPCAAAGGLLPSGGLQRILGEAGGSCPPHGGPCCHPGVLACSEKDDRGKPLFMGWARTLADGSGHFPLSNLVSFDQSRGPGVIV